MTSFSDENTPSKPVCSRKTAGDEDPSGGGSNKPSMLFCIARTFIRFGLPLGFIVVALFASRWLIRTSPRAGRRGRPSKRSARMVQTKKVQRKDHKISVSVMGTVIPAKRVTLHPQIQGKVVSLGKALIPGGFVKRGTGLVRIEGNDYQLAVKQQESRLAMAKAQLEQEKGRRAVAAKEYELMKKDIEGAGGSKELMLREPQLQAAKAEVDNAKAALSKSRLDLGRTFIKAPFNAVIESRSVDVGSHVTVSTPMATIVGTDAYWIDTLVPVDQLRWVRFPEKGKGGTPGSEVIIRDIAAWGPGRHRKGIVLRLLPGLEEKGRMARILVEVKDPLALQEENEGQPEFLMGAYVSVEIDGGVVKSMIALERDYLRDNDTVWVMDKDSKLDIRKVSMTFKGRDWVYISDGLEDGESVVLTTLSGAVQGMPLREQKKKKKKSSLPEETKTQGVEANQDGRDDDGIGSEERATEGAMKSEGGMNGRR
jgi:RND family efflux transporter MFP subunit